MNTSVKSYKYLLVACAFVILLLSVWLYVIFKTNPLLVFSGPHIDGAIINATITVDGSVHLFDGQGNLLKSRDEQLPAAVKGDLKFVRSISLFGIKGSPMQVRVNTGDSTICFLIDDITGQYLGPCQH